MDEVDSGVADLVIVIRSLMVTEDTRRAFEHCRRMTKPGGEVLVNLYNVYHPYVFFVHRLTWPLRTFLRMWVRYW